MDLTLVGRSLSTLPNFIEFLALTVFMTAGFVAVYVSITPYREIALIRRGNLSAALSLGGALLGFAMPLASVIAHTTILVDVLVWGLVAMAVQMLAWLAIHLTTGGLAARIEADDRAAGTFLCFASLAAGLLDAACMTY